MFSRDIAYLAVDRFLAVVIESTSLKEMEDRSPFCRPLILLFWTSSDVSSGFQSQSGQPYLHLVEVYM